MLVPLLLAVVLVGAGATWLVTRYRDQRWAREVALPQIAQLADQGKFGDAFALASKAERAISGDASLAKLWPVISYQLSVDTVPSGADIYRKDYTDASAPWQPVGTTPFKNVRQPRGMFVWKIEKPGFGTVLRTTIALVGRAFSVGDSVEANITLDEAAKIPEGMVRVSPDKYPKTLYIP
ncbi:MAG: hypothetical protein WBX03_10655, partial [Terriglobales bacterium]